MIRPKRVRKKQQIINSLYIDYKHLCHLSPNACIGVNRIYFNTLANFAIQNRITDKHFWDIIRKYEKCIYSIRPSTQRCSDIFVGA